MSTAEPTYSVVRLAAGVGKGMPLLLLHVTDKDVRRARKRVREGDVGCLPVLRVVVALLYATGVDPAGHAWSSEEYLELLDMLGMPVFKWSPIEDAELSSLLTDEARRVNGGGTDGR